MLCAFYFEKMRILVLFRFLCFLYFPRVGLFCIPVGGSWLPLVSFGRLCEGIFGAPSKNTIQSGFASRRTPRFANMDESPRRRAHF